MNRKECLKIMVRCVAFVVVFSMLFGNATDLLMRHDDESNEIHAFYSESLMKTLDHDIRPVF